jgi:hypothetical protein
VGFFDWLFGRRKTTGEQIDDLLAPQRAMPMLHTDEHWRAFSPDPASDVYPLETGADNFEVYRRIKQEGVEVRSLANSKKLALSDFANGFLLFATEFDIYSRVALGKLKQQIDAGRRFEPWAVVVVNPSGGDLLKDSWYASKLHALDGSSADLNRIVAGVPFRVQIGGDGRVTDIVEGVYCTQAEKLG